MKVAMHRDDETVANAGVEKLGNLTIDNVYPWHGRPFPMEKVPVGTDSPIQ